MPPDLSRLACGFLLAVSLAGHAQEDEQPLYTVELIVFTTGPGIESAYRYPGEPDVSDSLDLIVPETMPPLPPMVAPADFEESPLDALDSLDSPARRRVFGDAASGVERDLSAPRSDSMPRVLPVDPNSPPSPELFVENPETVRLLDDEERTLEDAWNRLLRSPGYRPLVRLAWRQPAAPFGEPQPIRIHGGAVLGSQMPAFPLFPADDDPADAIEEIDGSVALERGRFLHLRVDLVRRVPDQADPARDRPLPLLGPGFAAGGIDDYLVHRLQERRQISRDSVNYFDHRHLGMIAVVREWTPPEPVDLP